MIADKVKLLNETVLECLNETGELNIVKKFTEAGIKVLKADFGFVWLINSTTKNLELIYKSSKLPFTPRPPRKGGRNQTAIESSVPNFVTKTKKTPDADYVRKYVKSFIIIPFVYKNSAYGSLVLCFKKEKSFSKGEKILSTFIGNSAAQAITIHRLVLSEQQALALKEKQKATEVLLEQEKMKMEFIANATHEFRTPLTIMRGYIYLATDKKNKKNKQKAIEEALKAVDEEIVNLSELLSDLVLLTTSESSAQKAVKLKPVNLAAIVHLAAQKLRNLAEEKGISVTEKAAAKHIAILGDERHLERLFLNIIRNAITYGGTKIKIAIETSGKNVAVKIEDDGIGISQENLPHIFERFFRADKSHHREGGHSGLGLAISKWIAEMHGGKIHIKSALGVGSTFTVILPKKNT